MFKRNQYQLLSIIRAQNLRCYSSIKKYFLKSKNNENQFKEEKGGRQLQYVRPLADGVYDGGRLKASLPELTKVFNCLEQNQIVCLKVTCMKQNQRQKLTFLFFIFVPSEV